MPGSETNKEDKRYETYFDVMATRKCKALRGRRDDQHQSEAAIFCRNTWTDK